MTAEFVTQKSIKYLLLATAFTPLILTRNTIYPFIFGKMVFFRALVEMAAALFLVKILLSAGGKKKDENTDTVSQKTALWFAHPLLVSLYVYFGSVIISAAFAVNKYRALWGNAERAEGLFGLLHFLVFVLLALACFNRTDWLRYFKFSLMIGCVVAFYGWLQFLGIQQFPFALHIQPRPGSFIGNAGFLATHMIFTMVFGFMVWRESPAGSPWRTVAAIGSIFALGTVFITGTRGAILGVGAGMIALFLWKALVPQDSLEKIGRIWNNRTGAVVLLLFLFVGGGVFWITRTEKFWQSVPGLNRLAKTKTFDVNDPSTQMRILTWRLSLNAFKEKPLFGWGPENYLTAYVKHYDPEMARYGETWFDRAHNKIFDVAVTQGVFGLISYGALLFFLIRALVKMKQSLAVGGVVAYAAQNLLLLDQLLSYAAFFALVGYALSSASKEGGLRQEQPSVVRAWSRLFVSFKRSMSARIAVVAGIAVLAYSMFVLNYIPFTQAKTAQSAKQRNRIEVVMIGLEEAFRPYNFAQYDIRGNVVDGYYDSQPEVFENPDLARLGDLLIKSIEEIVAREPYDPRMFLRVAEMYSIKARQNPEWYRKEERVMREALNVAPRRQELYYDLAFALGAQGKAEEAIETMREVINLNPKVARAHLHLAMILSMTSEESFAEAERALYRALQLDPSMKTFISTDMMNTIVLYDVWGRKDKVTELILRDIDDDIGISSTFPPEYYEEALKHLMASRDTTAFIKVAEALSVLNFEQKNDMDTLIDLAKKERWDILEKL